MTQAEDDSFERFNEEIDNLHKYMKDHNYTDAEIRQVFAPLRRSTTWKTMKKTLIILSIPTLFCALIYLLTYSETMHWHLSAIGRIILIKLLPIWDWTVLKNQRCLLANPLVKPTPPEVYYNCDLCENIGNVDVREDIDKDLIKARYLDVHQPVIIAQDPGWENATNILKAIQENKIITTSIPCNVASSVFDGAVNVGKLLRRAQLFDSFFLHFRNCELGPMKHFRSFTIRPKFIPTLLSPIQYNWLVWSKNYNMAYFKPLTMTESYGALVQILGNFTVKLMPHHSCDSYCPVVEIVLKQGETLMFSSLWDLEYRSNGGENMAILLEFHKVY